MEDKTTYSKTARGFREVVNKTKDVSRELRRVLELVDGKSDFKALLKALDDYSEKALHQAIAELIRGGYLRDPEEYRVLSARPGATARPPPLVSRAENEFDFTAMAESPSMPAAPAIDPAEAPSRIKAKQDADTLARRLAAETQVRNEAEAQIQQDARTKARQEAEVLARHKAEDDRVQKEAEAQIRREAEIKVQQEAEADALRREEEAHAAELVAKQAKEKIQLDEKREIEARLKREAEAKAKKEAEEIARRQVEQEQERKKAETLIRQEVEAKAKQEAEAFAQHKMEEERLQREAEAEAAEQKRREIWAQSRLEAKILAQRKAEEEQAKQEAEAQIQREMEAAAQKKRDALAQRKAEEEQARQEAEAQIQREIEAAAQQERDALAQRKIEEKRAKKAAAAQKKVQAKMRREALAKKKAEARAKRETRELADTKAYADETDKGFAVAAPLQDRKNRRLPSAGWAARIASMIASMRNTLAGQSRERKKRRKNSLRVAVFVIFSGLAILHFISFDDRLSALEKTATAQFKQPVKAKTLHFWLLPTPHWRLQDVTIGNQGQIRLALVKAKVSIGTLFGSQNTIASLDAESATLNAEGAEWLLAGKAQGNTLGLTRIEVKGARVVAPFGALPNFDVNATLDAQGNWQKIELRTPGQKFNAELEATGNGTRVTLSAGAYILPLRLDSVNLSKPETLTLNNFSAVGMLAGKEFVVSDFSGEVNGGYVSGKARLNWRSGWVLNGEAKAKFFDTAAMFPALSKGGLLSGNGTFAMQAADPGALMASARAQGNFLIEHGVLNGIDLGQALRGLGGGGRTPYATFDGTFAYSGGKTQLRHLRMIDGIMTATGSADITADKMISSRFLVELKSSFINERSSVAVTGSLDAPQYGR